MDAGELMTGYIIDLYADSYEIRTSGNDWAGMWKLCDVVRFRTDIIPIGMMIMGHGCDSFVWLE